MNATDKRVRIGGACGFWGDSAMATPQLLQVLGLQYLVYDYLAETTMAILAKARAKDPTLGYATDFVQAVMTPHLLAIHERGIKVIANAGGLNPEGCRGALLQVAEKQGIALRVAVVTGDDLMPQMGTLQAQGLRTTADQPLPERPLSANAYVGARGIAQALGAGADVVITGRCVDSAVVLGALVHEFGWSWQDWDRLSAGTLAGHLIECGAQATGGLFTDWQDVPDWANIGYPVIDVAPDGSLELSKPEGTGGLIHPGAVAEQILYEVGDPANYLMPDVCCDWRHVQVERTGHDTVKVSGARGLPAPTHYKANATWQDGYQLQLMLAIRGIDAPLKAEHTAQALLARSRTLMATQGFGDYSETCVELLGGESHYGPHAQAHSAREVVLRIAVRHAQAKALAVLQRECASSGTSMGPGTRSSFSGRADIQPVIKLCAFMLPKTQVRLQMRLDDQLMDASDHGACAATQTTRTEATPPANPTFPENVHDNEPLHDCRLIDLAWARSGDKGDDENIGVIARHPKAWAWLRAQLQATQVQTYFSHLVQGPVLRYEVPGLQALNFVLHQALGGGGVCSLRSDPLGKSFAQMLLDMPLRVPASVLATPPALRHPSESHHAMNPILEGIKVLDLTRVIAGPMCTQILADMGATVYKIEKPGEGDDTRRMGPFLQDPATGQPSNDSALYLAYNRGKQSITVDIASEEGAQIVRDLALRCDVVVENYKVGSLAKYGLDADSLRRLKPELIYCSVTGFGQTGPSAPKPAYDFILQGMAGPMSTCGLPDDQPSGGPMRTSIPMTDMVTGLYATIGILGALMHRQKTGQGQAIDAAMLDATVAFNGHLAVGYLMSGQSPQRVGNTNPIASPSEVFECAEGRLIIAAGNNTQFGQLCTVLGAPDMPADPRFATNMQRIAHRSELQAALQALVRAKPRAQLLEQLSAANVPAGPINNMAQVFADPQTQHRQMVVELPHSSGQTVRLVRSPLNWSASPVTHRAPPRLGEHSLQTLREELGLTDAQVEGLVARGVV